MNTELDLNQANSFFFIGVAGTGMSAIAQYLRGCGKTIAGSDRQFAQEEKSLIQTQLEKQGIACFPQDGSGIDKSFDVVVISTAIEETNVEYQKALELNIPVIKRSALLAHISNNTKTIAVGGTSGKSTTTAMIFHILSMAGKRPSLITGAGLSELQAKGLPGNAWKGEGEWLVIEADESDGSIVGYKPTISVLLNVERDHKEADDLMKLFTQFRANTKGPFIVNADNELAAKLAVKDEWTFSCGQHPAGIVGNHFQQQGFEIQFTINGSPVYIPVIGKHNMENALAAFSVCRQMNVMSEVIIRSLARFKGIYRRSQLTGKNASKNQYVVDDFAHNPSEVAAAIQACQSICPRVIAYFQPHGFGPLRFMHKELAEEVAAVLRPNDTFLIGDVYYAGGTVNKDISPTIVSDAIVKKGKNAVFVGDKAGAKKAILEAVKTDTVVLVMGARDPKLDAFSEDIYRTLIS